MLQEVQWFVPLTVQVGMVAGVPLSQLQKSWLVVVFSGVVVVAAVVVEAGVEAMVATVVEAEVEVEVAGVVAALLSALQVHSQFVAF